MKCTARKEQSTKAQLTVTIATIFFGLLMLSSAPAFSQETPATAEVVRPSDLLLSPDNAALLLIDHQSGLSSSVQDADALTYYNGVLALANIGKVFKLPTVVTAINPEGVLGGTLPEIGKILPNATVIHRHGPVNAWEEPAFRNAVKRLNRKKLIIAGVTTDVCATLPALSAAAEGYDVYVVIDASGSMNPLVREITLHRLVKGGVTPTNWYAVLGELLKDTRKAPADLGEVLKHWTPGTFLEASYEAAKNK